MERKLSVKILNFCILILFLIIAGGCEKDEPPVVSNLYDLINTYRVEKGLPKIPFSPSLTTVAETHVRDLADNQPNTGKCNLHSWSDKGNWSACCYTGDHAAASCSWSKPRELTSYTGNGYEIAAWVSNGITAGQALDMWKKSEGHHNVILNRDVWADAEWKALGTAVYKGYAVAWFGRESDNRQP